MMCSTSATPNGFCLSVSCSFLAGELKAADEVQESRLVAFDQGPSHPYELTLPTSAPTHVFYSHALVVVLNLYLSLKLLLMVHMLSVDGNGPPHRTGAHVNIPVYVCQGRPKQSKACL